MPTSKSRIDAPKELIDDLVAANRILARQGVLDAYGHVSVRTGRKAGHYLLSRSLAPELVTPKDILELGPDSEPVGDARKSYLERFIHGEIYRTRPDVVAIVHSHSQSVIPFGATRTKLRPISHMASFLWSGAPVFDIRGVREESDMLIRDIPLGRALAKSLGPCTCVLMRGHGMTVVGESLPDVVFRAIYTEANARMQMQAASLEGPIEFLSDAEARNVTATNRATLERPWTIWKARIRGKK